MSTVQEEVWEVLRKFAYRRGLFVLVQSGDTVTTLNDEDFQPGV